MAEEVLSARIPAGLESLFAGLLKRINRVGVDSKIASLAHDLRNFYVLRASEYENKTLSTPDAIHLAMAILYRATEFHTFDKENSGKSLGLIPLSENIGGHKLKICIPEARNPQLDLRR